MDRDIPAQAVSIPPNEEENTDMLYDNISLSSNYQTVIEETGTASPDLNKRVTSSISPAEERTAESEAAQATKLLFPDNFKPIKRSKSIASSLKANDGYGIGNRYRVSYWATDVWFYDFLALSTSYSCFVGIITTLSIHRDQPVPGWPFGITINALVSVLSTIMGSALLVPVSSTLGQAKWSWIGKERRKLADIAIYDEAKQGPLGLAGAVVEQGTPQTTAVALENRPVENSSAALTATYWWAEGLRTESGPPRIKDDMVMAINRGLFFDGNFRYPFSMSAIRPRPQCQTGNCSFGVFESLAICSECQDLTHLLEVQVSEDGGACESHVTDDILYENVQGSCARWSLLNGYCSDWLDGSSTMLMNTSASRSPIMLRPGLSILNLTTVAPCWLDRGVLYKAENRYKVCDKGYRSSKWRAQAQECTLKWCVHQYEPSMANGILQENILSTTNVGKYSPGRMYDFSPPNSNVSYEVDPDTYYRLFATAGADESFMNISTGPKRGKLSVHRDANQLISSYLQQELEGFTALNDSYTVRGQPEKSNVRRLYKALGGTYYSSYNNDTTTGKFDMNPLFESMAISMTSSLRRSGSDRGTTDDSWDIPTVYHDITTAPSRLVPVLHVSWGWIPLPATLELATLLLLCYMVWWKSQRSVPVWKSSTLPLLLVGSEMHDAVGDSIPRHLVDMEEFAKALSIEPHIAMGRVPRLVKNELEDGWASNGAQGRKGKENFSVLSFD
ncbi:hypothetical protein PG994_014513 [Apiospora phragmitis]|uniref:Uncharacterized protein n=1 Tax=Apiospora phragmitis TaxID=2905665 RepID=A0ABR1T4I6_9PEZI